MPNRYLRESYKESEPVNKVTWPAEVMWTRLIVTVDDWGRTEANPKLLRAKLFPLRLDTVRESDVPRWLAECEKAGLIRLYHVDGKEYLEMNKWERGRAEKSRYPDPPPLPLQTVANNCLQPPANAPDSDTDSDTDTDMAFARFWDVYPRKVAKPAARKAWDRHQCTKLVEIILSAVERQKKWVGWTKDAGQYIPYPATWLNNSRWMDEAATPELPLESKPEAFRQPMNKPPEPPPGL